MRTTRVVWGISSAVILGLAFACGDEDQPGGTSVVISAPAAVGPTQGAIVSEQRPTLTVSNVTASDGSTPTYSFQVASDSAFASVVAQTSGVTQGSGGRTAWQVTTDLQNSVYYWRARARSGATDGPYSTAADFRVSAGGFASGTPVNGILVSDPLIGGQTVGERRGGEFTAQGWKVVTRDNYIRYAVPTLESGFVEWDNIGIPYEVDEDKQYMLLGMWDPTRGGYRDNAYRVNVQKLDAAHNPPFIRLRWISEREEHDEGNDFLDWDPAKRYHWRLEWGPAPGGHQARVYLDGAQIITANYGPAYRPVTHWIELGIQERKESIIGVVYSNVRIGPR